MSEVNVTINGRQYRMACENGQEEHLLKLSQDLDQRIAQLRTSFGEVGDTRLTVMAALTVADELAEAGKRIRALEEELAGLKDAGGMASDRTHATQAERVMAWLGANADLARSIEVGATTPMMADEVDSILAEFATPAAEPAKKEATKSTGAAAAESTPSEPARSGQSAKPELT